MIFLALPGFIGSVTFPTCGPTVRYAEGSAFPPAALACEPARNGRSPIKRKVGSTKPETLSTSGGTAVERADNTSAHL